MKFSDGKSCYYNKEKLEEVQRFCSILSSGRFLELNSIDQQTFDRIFPWMRVLGPHDVDWIAEAMIGEKKKDVVAEPDIKKFEMSLLLKSDRTVAIYGPDSSGRRTFRDYFSDVVSMLAGKPVDKSRWSIGSRVLGCATYVAVSCQNKDNVFPAVPNFLEALEV
ncbi:MAG: hypothetical protein P4L69_05150, partial [Desulfosporosinus sp.]|nr:hypothetical protein [Desulfosporosinus sp.]